MWEEDKIGNLKFYKMNAKTCFYIQEGKTKYKFFKTSNVGQFNDFLTYGI